MRKTPTLERSKLRGESLVIVGTGMGYNWGGYEHFFKGQLGYETFWNTFKHCDMKSCTNFGMGYETWDMLWETQPDNKLQSKNQDEKYSQFSFPHIKATLPYIIDNPSVNSVE